MSLYASSVPLCYSPLFKRLITTHIPVYAWGLVCPPSVNSPSTFTSELKSFLSQSCQPGALSLLQSATDLFCVAAPFIWACWALNDCFPAVSLCSLEDSPLLLFPGMGCGTATRPLAGGLRACTHITSPYSLPPPPPMPGSHILSPPLCVSSLPLGASSFLLSLNYSSFLSFSGCHHFETCGREGRAIMSILDWHMLLVVSNQIATLF